MVVRQEIEQVGSPYHVVLMVRDRLSGLSPRELERLPDVCRARAILDEADVLSASRALTQAYWQLRGTAADVGVLQEMWSFFQRASMQIARLREQAAGRA